MFLRLPHPDPLVRGMDPWDPNPETDPNPDPFARGTDPQIRIRIKMSRIRKTAENLTSFGIRPLKFEV